MRCVVSHYDVVDWLLPREKSLYDAARPRIGLGRHWDAEHILFSLTCTRFICQKEPEVRKHRCALVPAVILHDIGWSLMSAEERDDGRYRGREARIKHMQLGSEFAQRLMIKKGYDPETIDSVAIAIREHDNQYTGDPTTLDLTYKLREIDVLWTLSSNSFGRRHPTESPLDFLDAAYARAESHLITDTAKRLATHFYRMRRAEVNQ